MDVISLSDFITSCIQEATSNFVIDISIPNVEEEVTSIMSSIIPSPLSQEETLHFHIGLPSGPPLIARTGVPWKQPWGPEAYSHKRKLQVVGKHPIAVPGLWRGQVGPKILDILNEFRVKWHTIDVARIAYEDDEAYEDVEDGDSHAPPVVWIAVEPGSLSGNEGNTVACQCQEVLNSFGLNDVEVCIRGSKYYQEAVSHLEASGFFFDPIADLCKHSTSAVGFPISTNNHPTAEGSLGLFFINGSDTSTVYFLTARHVVIPQTTCNDNKLYNCKNLSHPCHNVTIFSENHLKAIRIHIGEVGMLIEHDQHRINRLEGREDEAAVKEREEAQTHISIIHGDLENLEKFYDYRFKFWHSAHSRTIGAVTLSPPITFSISNGHYTEDWAIGQVDINKIDVDTFCPNTLDLGFEFTFHELNSLMNPNSENPPSFEYPDGCLLPIRGTVSDAEIRNPCDKDENGDPCITVLKRGKKTGLTVGRVNNVDSFVRIYWNDGTVDTSMELPVFGYDSRTKQTKPFSEPGDSGSVVVDGKGRVIGMIIGGVGFTTTSDVTYVTPAEFLFDKIRSHGINPNIDFTLKAAA